MLKCYSTLDRGPNLELLGAQPWPSTEDSLHILAANMF